MLKLVEGRRDAEPIDLEAERAAARASLRQSARERDEHLARAKRDIAQLPHGALRERLTVRRARLEGAVAVLMRPTADEAHGLRVLAIRLSVDAHTALMAWKADD